MAGLGPLWAVLHIAISTMTLIASRSLFASGFCAHQESEDLINELIAVYGVFCLFIFAMIGVGYFVPQQSAGMTLSIAAAFLSLAIMRLVWTIMDPRILTPIAFSLIDIATAIFIFWQLKSDAHT